MARAHRLAYKTLHKKKQRPIFVGVAHKMSAYVPAHKSNLLERFLAATFKKIGNDWFLHMIRKHQDYIGFNYYFLQRIHLGQRPSFMAAPDAPKSDLGWEIAPEGMLKVLRELHAYRKPIIILENGLADSKDDRRWPYIIHHLLMIYTAISEGVDVVGYMHWSLLDNFEWAEGYGARFGLIEVDFATQKRTVRKSALKYAEIARNNAISPEAILPFFEKNKDAYPDIIGRHLQKLIKLKPE
jgi:beta-glucosidase